MNVMVTFYVPVLLEGYTDLLKQYTVYFKQYTVTFSVTLMFKDILKSRCFLKEDSYAYQGCIYL